MASAAASGSTGQIASALALCMGQLAEAEACKDALRKELLRTKGELHAARESMVDVNSRLLEAQVGRTHKLCRSAWDAFGCMHGMHLVAWIAWDALGCMGCIWLHGMHLVAWDAFGCMGWDAWSGDFACCGRSSTFHAQFLSFAALYTLQLARVCCVGRGPQVFLSQAGLSVPAPAQRLATFTRVPIAAGQSVVVTLPPIPPVYRSVIHETGGNASDVYSLAGKRWNEAGNLLLRISLGGHGEATTGGLPFTVAQTASQDVETCAN